MQRVALISDTHPLSDILLTARHGRACTIILPYLAARLATSCEGDVKPLTFKNSQQPETVYTMNNLEQNITQLMQDMASIKSDVHQVKLDIAVVREQQKHNREMNEREHQEMMSRIGVLEVADREQRGVLNAHQGLINKADGASKVVTILARAGWGLLISVISGLAVYLLMR